MTRDDLNMLRALLDDYEKARTHLNSVGINGPVDAILAWQSAYSAWTDALGKAGPDLLAAAERGLKHEYGDDSDCIRCGAFGPYADAECKPATPKEGT